MNLITAYLSDALRIDNFLEVKNECSKIWRCCHGAFDSNILQAGCVQGSPINDSLWLKQQEQEALDAQNSCSRSAADIMKVVRQKTPSLRQIYNKALKKKKNFQGKVKIKFVIKPEGNVAETSVDSSTTGNDAFDNEISAAVKLWNFGKHKCNDGNLANVTTVTIPFTFSE